MFIDNYFNSTIWSQLFKYQINRIIHCYSVSDQHDQRPCFSLSLIVFLLSTVESNKNIKNILKIVKEIKKIMVASDEMEEFKEQISVELAEVKEQIAQNCEQGTGCTKKTPV